MSSELKDPGFHKRLAQLIGSEMPFGWASRMGISKGAFSRIWNEGTIPGPDHLKRIAEKTGVSIDWLLTGEGPVQRHIVPTEHIAPKGLAEASILYSASPGRDPELAEIMQILEQDLPEAKRFVLKVLRGRKEIKEGLEGLGMTTKEEDSRC